MPRIPTDREDRWPNESHDTDGRIHSARTERDPGRHPDPDRVLPLSRLGMVHHRRGAAVGDYRAASQAALYLAWQASRQGVPPQVAQERFQERLLALSRTHNLLNETLWEDASLRIIREAELQPYAAGPSRIRLDGPEVHVAPRGVGNGLPRARHQRGLVRGPVVGGRPHPGGLASRRAGRRHDAHHRLVRDGRTPGRAERRPGFGSRLLRQTITRELGGRPDVRFERSGVCCKILVPVGLTTRQAA